MNIVDKSTGRVHVPDVRHIPDVHIKLQSFLSIHDHSSQLGKLKKTMKLKMHTYFPVLILYKSKLDVS